MQVTLGKEKMMSLVVALVAIYAAALLPVDVLAASGYGGSEPTALSNVLCNVVSWFTGSIGAGIATLAIIVIGIGALMGKVSWGMAIIVGIGVGVVFGAPTIVSALGATSTC
jgi:type IV secretion system protein VirB2